MPPVHAGPPIPSPPGGGCLPFASLVPSEARPETTKVAGVLLRAGYVIVRVDNGRTTWRCGRALTSYPVPVPKSAIPPLASELNQYESTPQAAVLRPHEPSLPGTTGARKPIVASAFDSGSQTDSHSGTEGRPALPSATLPTPPTEVPALPLPPITVPAGSMPAHQLQDLSQDIPLPEARALAERLLPERVVDRTGWARDIVGALDTLRLPSTTEYLCATMAVIGQESGFQVDPAVPGLPKKAWVEIEKRRAKYSIPKALLDAAVALRSPTGRTYKERIDTVRTERELSAIYEDFVLRVPLGERLFGHLNPVRTLGSMQISIDFIATHARQNPDAVPKDSNLRAIGFSRRGSIYFGAAHLLDYVAPYDEPIYRFADYNAGRYASRNAALQYVIARLSGIHLALDGVLLLDDKHGNVTGDTLRASVSIGPLLGLDQAQIVRDLRLSRKADLEQSEFYQRVYKLADEHAGKPLPRAMLPQIKLAGPKIQRNYLTTSWFAQRVTTRYRACLARSGAETIEARKQADKTFMAGW